MAKAPQKSKDAKAKAAAGGGKKSKKKWSKGKSRDKLQNMCLFDKPTYDKVLKEVPNYKVRTGIFTRKSFWNGSIFEILSHNLFLGHHPINRLWPYEDPRFPRSTCNQRTSRYGQDQAFGPTLFPNGLHQSHRCWWRRRGGRWDQKEGKEISHSLIVLIQYTFLPVHSWTAIWSDGLRSWFRSRDSSLIELSHSKANWYHPYQCWTFILPIGAQNQCLMVFFSDQIRF